MVDEYHGQWTQIHSHKLLGMIEKEAGAKIIKESKMVNGINTPATPPQTNKTNHMCHVIKLKCFPMGS